MLPIEIKVGYVFRYCYLWRQRQTQGHEEGDKDRPCLRAVQRSLLKIMESIAPRPPSAAA